LEINAMRVTDDRYTRDRQRLDLAVRMIRHEARTGTIRHWTGLSDDRIRKLYRTYLQHTAAHPCRHRGKPPRQVSYFLRNRETRRQSALLGGLFGLIGLLGCDDAEPRARDGASAMHWGDRFCRVYETYLALEHARLISFEHACYLLQVLERRAELALDECPSCQSLMVVDTLRVRDRRCAFCEADALWRSGSGIPAGPERTRQH
jgi:Flagellar transcriptional activator (FlhC)